MDQTRKDQDASLVCTCNDLYVDDIQEAVDFGETEYREIFALHGLQPRCGECRCHVESLVDSENK